MKPEISIVVDADTASPIELGAVRNAALKYLKQGVKKREVIFVVRDILIGKLFCEGNRRYLDYPGTFFSALFVSRSGEEARPKVLILQGAELHISAESEAVRMHQCLQMPDGTIIHSGKTVDIAMGLRDIEFPSIN